MALAQRETDVAIHHASLVVTHQHLTGTPEHDDFPRFLRTLNRETSCAINTLLARERYDQPGELFDKRSTHVMRLCDAAAQSTTLNYEFLNTTAAGLVSRPEQMPGFVFNYDLWLEGYIDVPRPDFYCSHSQPETLRLEVTPPPLLYRAFDGNLDTLVYNMKRLAEHGARELRAARKGEALGARKLQRLHPWSEPRTLRETRGKPIPTFRIGARGIVGQLQHIDAAKETQGYRLGYRESLEARRAGDLEREFPYGCYQMRVEHGVPVAPAPQPGTAIVTCPGPTLRQVQAELEARRERGQASPNKEARIALVEASREAFRDEAHDICESASEGMDFRSPPRTVSVPVPSREEASEDTDEREVPAIVRHRFDKPDHQGRDRVARRVVTLRDRRMGRRPKTTHGSDPPD